MTTICEDRYGRGWVAWSADPEDAPPGFNCGDSEHDAFYRREHHFPMGWGRSPDTALVALRREVERYKTEYKVYTCRLLDQSDTVGL